MNVLITYITMMLLSIVNTVRLGKLWFLYFAVSTDMESLVLLCVIINFILKFKSKNVKETHTPH